MAKNKKDLFREGFSKSKKPTDEEIEKVAGEVNEPKEQKKDEGEKGYHIKFPMSHYKKLVQVSEKTHIPMKYIIIQALQEYYDNHNYWAIM